MTFFRLAPSMRYRYVFRRASAVTSIRTCTCLVVFSALPFIAIIYFWALRVEPNSPEFAAQPERTRQFSIVCITRWLVGAWASRSKDSSYVRNSSSSGDDCCDGSGGGDSRSSSISSCVI